MFSKFFSSRVLVGCHDFRRYFPYSRHNQLPTSHKCGEVCYFSYICTVGLHTFHINKSVSQINLFIHTLFHKSTVFHINKGPLRRGLKVQESFDFYEISGLHFQKTRIISKGCRDMSNLHRTKG